MFEEATTEAQEGESDNKAQQGTGERTESITERWLRVERRESEPRSNKSEPRSNEPRSLFEPLFDLKNRILWGRGQHHLGPQDELLLSFFCGWQRSLMSSNFPQLSAEQKKETLEIGRKCFFEDWSVLGLSEPQTSSSGSQASSSAQARTKCKLHNYKKTRGSRP